jgi:hypothetical protein
MWPPSAKMRASFGSPCSIARNRRQQIRRGREGGPEIFDTNQFSHRLRPGRVGLLLVESRLKNNLINADQILRSSGAVVETTSKALSVQASIA